MIIVTFVLLFMWFSNMAKIFLLLCCFVGAFASSSLLGGVEEVDKKDPEVLKALSFAMDEYNMRSNNLFREMATEVKEATKQIVAGEKFCIVTVVGTSRSCRNDDKHKSATLEACPVDSLNMVCKFEVLVAPWEKVPQKILNYACDDLNAARKIISCHYIAPYLPNIKPKNEKEKIELIQFYTFVEKYKKSYKSEEEIKERFKIFQQNLVSARKMKEMDSGTAQYGVTQFSDLTAKEFKKLYMMPGWGKPLYEMKPADIPQGDVPASFDWRTKGAVTPVKNQATCGSCWAFSTTGNVEGQWSIKKGKLLSLSEQELVDCDKVDHGCEGGLPANAYKQIEKLGGLETEQEYPYTGSDGKCKFDKSDIRVTINGSVAISSNEDEMAAWLAKNGPISIGINAMAMQFYMGGVAHPWKIFCSPLSLDHGVLIVGYGVKHGLFGKTPYWIIKNSWGPGWGEQGYYRIYRGGGCCGLNTACTSAVID